MAAPEATKQCQGSLKVTLHAKARMLAKLVTRSFHSQRRQRLQEAAGSDPGAGSPSAPPGLTHPPGFRNACGRPRHAGTPLHTLSGPGSLGSVGREAASGPAHADLSPPHGLPCSSTWLLLKNPAFVLLCLAGATEATLITGMSTFGPKFLESQFSLSASDAATLFGEKAPRASGVPCSCVGSRTSEGWAA